MAKVGQVKDMEKVAGDMMAVLDTQVMLAAITMGEQFVIFASKQRIENNNKFLFFFLDLRQTENMWPLIEAAFTWPHLLVIRNP